MSLLDLFFPKRCVGCKKLGAYFCESCSAKISYVQYQICPVCGKHAVSGATHPRCQTKYSIDGMFALAHYKGPMRNAIHQLKYRYVSDVAKTLVQLLYSHYPVLPTFDYLLPIPLHQKKEKQRGFNQSTLLTKQLSNISGIPFNNDLVKRIKYTVPQVTLHGKERKQNIKHAFTCVNEKDVQRKIIALIDDVATTRSTLIECARVLKRSGAKSVWGIVLAHG